MWVGYDSGNGSKERKVCTIIIIIMLLFFFTDCDYTLSYY